MNSAFLFPFRSTLRFSRALAAAAAFATLAVGASRAADPAAAPTTPSAPPAEPQLENSVTLAAGGSLVNGDKATFQKLREEKKDGWAGVEQFHFTRTLPNNINLTADGHALFGNNDYRLNLKLNREDAWFVNIGAREYRVWFDPSGGYFPPTNLFFAPITSDMHIDRGNFFIEGGTSLANGINILLRYEYTLRRGMKDSTEWGDTNLTGIYGTRAIVPTFLRIREHRHIVTAKVSQDTEQTSWQVDGRYEKQKQENSRNMRRQPLSAIERVATQKDGSDVDLYLAHGAVETKIGPTLTLGAGAAHYDIDNVITGSRIYGQDYDPVFSATAARRQFHDEGFLDLTGSTHMKQTLANLNLMYTPSETWTIVPELRAQRSTWGGSDNYEETAVGAGPAFVTDLEEMHASSDKSYRDLTEVIEARYTGFRNVALNGSVQATQSYGTLTEDLIAVETGVDSPYRTTDFRRDEQKYEVSAHMYPMAGLNFTVQYYWKGRQNSFSNTRTSLAPTGADRYPAYISHQDLETNDANFRVSWVPFAQVRTTTRYDYQESKLRTQEVGLPFIQTAKVKTHMLSESITYSPLTTLYIQVNGNLVFDQTTTPAVSLTGAAFGLVRNSDNNYFNGDITAGYVLDDKSDLTLTYFYYRANNYIDNSRYSQPYGADARTHLITAAFSRRVSANLSYTIRYAWGQYRDYESGGNNNFRSHSLYAAVQHRF
jgi:hypothetical protein